MQVLEDSVDHEVAAGMPKVTCLESSLNMLKCRNAVILPSASRMQNPVSDLASKLLNIFL